MTTKNNQSKQERKYRYKVVKRRTRCSAMVSGGSKYGLKYETGTYVHADPDTLGIFVFKSRHSAEFWARHWNKPSRWEPSRKDLIVIKVLPIGRGKRVGIIASFVSTDELDEFYDTRRHLVSEPPNDTMTYKSVRVID